VFIVIVIGSVGWYVWHAKQDTDKILNETNKINSNNNQQANESLRRMEDFRVSRAKFSIKYPANWTYAEQVGDKDGVEHITIAGDHLKLSIDSFTGTDTTDGGTTGTTCSDCQKTASSRSFKAGKLGAINIQTVTYALDNESGNALILRQPDGTYYIASPSAANVKSTFRAISSLNSEQAYQAETPSQFTANPDFSAAQKVLESVSY